MFNISDLVSSESQTKIIHKNWSVNSAGYPISKRYTISDRKISMFSPQNARVSAQSEQLPKHKFYWHNPQKQFSARLSKQNFESSSIKTNLRTTPVRSAELPYLLVYRTNFNSVFFFFLYIKSFQLLWIWPWRSTKKYEEMNLFMLQIWLFSAMSDSAFELGEARGVWAMHAACLTMLMWIVQFITRYSQTGKSYDTCEPDEAKGGYFYTVMFIFFTNLFLVWKIPFFHDFTDLVTCRTGSCRIRASHRARARVLCNLNSRPKSLFHCPSYS